MKAQKISLKKYFQGFIEGLGMVLIILLLPSLLITLLTGKTSQDFHQGFRVILWLFGILFSNYLVVKNKLPKAWAIVSIFLGILTVPFITAISKANK